jgi:hypothetical protein
MTASYAADKSDIAGDWTGTLKTPGPELRLVLHVQKAEGEAWKATLDSVDQGSNGIPVAQVSLDGNRLKLDVAAVKGTYDGEVSADGKTITGKWQQGGADMPLSFTRADLVKEEPVPDNSATVAPLLGVWEGALDTGNGKLRLRLTLTKDDKGQITGKFDSIDQSAMGLPVSALSLTAEAFHFDLRAVGGSYDGKVSADRQTVEGMWRQGSGHLPLALKKVA